MQIQPLVTVKQAAEVLGVGKKFIRKKLTAGEMKGERRIVGEKEKWFVYQGEVDNLLESQQLPSLPEKASRISTDGLNEFFENQTHGEEPISTTNQDSEPVYQSNQNAQSDSTANEIFTPENEVTPSQVFDATPTSTGLIHLLPYIEDYLHSLGLRFAQHLAVERATAEVLQEELQIKVQLLQAVPQLEDRLRRANETIQTKDLELSHLKAHIRGLETELEKARKPWWQKLFA